MGENTQLRNINAKTYLLLGALALGFGWFSAYSGAVVLAFSISAAAFSCIFSSISSLKKRVITIAILGAFLSLPTVIFGLPFLFTATTILLFSVLLSFGYSSKMIKPDVVLIATLLLSVCLLGISYAWIGKTVGSYEKGVVLASLSQFTEEFRSLLLSAFEMPEYQAVYNTFGTAYFEAIIDTLFNLRIAFMIIIAFFVCGLSMKLFSFIWKRIHREDEFIEIWRFTVPASFAYFYVILFVFQFFLSDRDSVLFITVVNLFLIFMMIFAYLGLRFLLFAISKRSRRKALFYCLLVLGILMFSSVAIEIISLNGVLAVIIANRYQDKFRD